MATRNSPTTPESGPWEGDVESLLLDQIDAAVIAVDLSGVVTHWNTHAERMFGWSRAEVLGGDVMSIGCVPPEDGQGEEVLATLRAGESWEGDMALVRKDGTPFLAFVKNAPLRCPSGNLIGFVAVSVDVTERRRVESALEQRNAALLRAKKVARLESWEWNPGMDVVEYEDTGEQSTGEGRATFEEILAARVHPDDHERVRQSAARLLAAGHGSTIVHYKGLTPDGGVRHVSTIAEVEADDEGRPVTVLGISQDVTEQREAELALRASEDARRRLLLQLVSAEDGERRRLAGDIHDDAIQVLHAALLRAEALSGMLTEPAQSASAARLEDAVRQAVGNLRNIVAGVRQPTFAASDLVPAIEAYLEEATTDWPVSHSVDSRVEHEPMPEVRSVLFRILVEAAVNARKHSGAQNLTVRVESDEEGVSVAVADDGRGFTYTGDAAGEAGHYGLATMKERAELAGGSLRVHSSPGAGTTIEAWVPHVSPEPHDDSPAATQERR